LRKDKGSERSFYAVLRLANDQHHGLPATVSAIGVDAIHLSKVILTWFNDASWVVVPFTDVVGANLALPALGQ